jgi:WD40 repeat protein
MKQWRLILGVILVILVSGCKPADGDKKQVETELPATEVSVPIESPTPLPAVISVSNAGYLRTVSQVQFPNPYHLEWSADGSRFAVASSEGFQIFDANSLKVLNNIQIQSYELLDFSLAANLFAITDQHQTIDLLDITTGTKVLSIKPTDIFPMAEFSPDGKTLLTTSDERFRADLWDVQTGNFLTSYTGFETAAPVYSVHFAAGGSKLVFVARGTVQVIDTASGALAARLEHEDFVQGWALSPDTRTMATASGATIGNDFLPIIKLWDPENILPPSVLLSGDMVSLALTYSPDGSLLASTNGKTLTLWDVTQQHRLGDWTAHSDNLTALAFSPDGTRLLSAAADGMVFIWMVQ